MKKPVCNRSSVSHFASARSKYYRRVFLCLFATIVIGLMTKIVIPEARLYWLIIWPAVLGFFNYRYWIRLAHHGYFECDECRKLKPVKHIKEFTKSGDRYVWCDFCLPRMRARARDMRAIRSIIAGHLLSSRSESRKQVQRPYTPMQKPALKDPKAFSLPSEPKIVIALPRRPSEDFAVSSPSFAKR